jgi:hypothetical protein
VIKRSRKWIAALWFCLGLLVFTGGNLQAARIQMTTRLGFGACVIPGRWVPLWVQIKGVVEPARVEVIRYSDGGGSPSCESFTLPNTGAAFSQLEIPLLADFKIKSVCTRLYHGEQLLTEQSLDLSNKIFPGHLILTISLPATEQQAIQKSLLPREPVLTVPIRPEELPSSGLNYDGVSGLVINDPSLVLAPAQIKTLRSWLAGGGRLVILATDPAPERASQPASLIESLAGHRNSYPKDEIDVFPLGFGSVTITRPKPGGAGILRLTGGWREILNLKPYLQTSRLSAGQCFPRTFTPKFGRKFSLLNPLSEFLFFWAGVGVFFSLFLKKKPVLIYFFILTLLSVAVTIPLAGFLASNWKHGATWHTRAVFLPDSGGMFINTAISLAYNPANEIGVYSSPWGMALKSSSNEAGGLKLETNRGDGKRMAFWGHPQSRSWYSLSAGDSNNLVLAGCFPEFTVSETGKPTNTPNSLNLKLHQIMIPNDTISWDGQQWRLLINNDLDAPRWREISKPPEWFQNDVEWMKHFQTLFPKTLWLGGRYQLPDRLSLKIQGGAIPEFFWVMPAPL